METVYSPSNLPIFAPHTSGHAIPVPEERICCAVPYATNILAPWELQKAAVGAWHMIIELDMPKRNVTFWPEGYPEGMPRCDEYSNNEVLYTCTPLEVMQYGDNEAADLLYLTYRSYPGVKVFKVRKTVPVIVLGQVTRNSMFRTAESLLGKAAAVPADSYILKSPLVEQYYFNTPKKFEQLYGGVIHPGSVPNKALCDVKEGWANFGVDTSFLQKQS